MRTCLAMKTVLQTQSQPGWQSKLCTRRVASLRGVNRTPPLLAMAKPEKAGLVVVLGALVLSAHVIAPKAPF